VRLLAVDYGERRVGLAISDPEGRLAVPLVTLERRSDRQVVRHIARLAAAEGVTGLVVGEPRRLDGEAGAEAERVRGFAAKLQAATGLPCRFVVETLTSVAAEERLRAAGVDLRRHPERIDQVAAQILLEEALASGG
jgi:putative Holliday junction resolvase